MSIDQVLISIIIGNTLTKIQHCRKGTNEESKSSSKKPSKRKDYDAEKQEENKVHYLFQLWYFVTLINVKFFPFISTGENSNLLWCSHAYIQANGHYSVLYMQEDSHCIICYIEEASHYRTWTPPWLWFVLLRPV